LPLIHSRGTIAALAKPRTRAEREEFYLRRWNSWRWRMVFRLFFSRPVMSRLGRDRTFFAHVDGPVGARLLERTRHALTALPVHTNPYLAYILTGTYPPGARPRCWRPCQMAVIRERLDRLRLAEGSAEEVGEPPFDGFNLSDIFEYMSAEEHESCYGSLAARARPGARLVYWNMLVPRTCPAAFRGQANSLTDLAAELHQRDQVWFYQQLHVDQVGLSC
jgi:S-adenosylmethionine-diacylglycerol 3-amino-3-carboxypropyl transferase